MERPDSNNSAFREKGKLLKMKFIFFQDAYIDYLEKSLIKVGNKNSECDKLIKNHIFKNGKK